MDLTIKGPKSSKRVGLGEIFRMNRGEIKYKGGEEGPILQRYSTLLYYYPTTMEVFYPQPDS